MNTLEAFVRDLAATTDGSARSETSEGNPSGELTPCAIRDILVPIDGRQDSLRTIRRAIELGQHFGSRLTLLYVYQSPIAFGIPSGTKIKTELLKDRQQAEERLKNQGTSVRAAYPYCEWIFRCGEVGKSIVDAALELRVDLIVISSHHPVWVDRFRRTNNPDHILRQVSCPVVEVRDNGETFVNYAEKIEH